jgi:hypothetical protein
LWFYYSLVDTANPVNILRERANANQNTIKGLPIGKHHPNNINLKHNTIKKIIYK